MGASEGGPEDGQHHLLDTTLDQRLFDVSVGQVVPQIPGIATMITSGENRNPAIPDTDTGGGRERQLADSPIELAPIKRSVNAPAPA